MRLFLIGLALILASCTTVKTGTSASQNYRLQGENNPVSIHGLVNNKSTMRAFDTVADTEVKIFFDGEQMIQGKLDQQLNGELIGQPYKGKPTSATCNSVLTGQKSGQNLYRLSCLVFIGNEKTVTLTF